MLDKIEEEVAEVRKEVESGSTGDLSRAEEEMGDLLFAITNLSRKLGIEPEAALRRANEKFTRRFDAMEHALAARGKTLSEATLEEMEAEWQRVKATPLAPVRNAQRRSKHPHNAGCGPNRPPAERAAHPQGRHHAEAVAERDARFDAHDRPNAVADDDAWMARTSQSATRKEIPV